VESEDFEYFFVEFCAARSCMKDDTWPGLQFLREYRSTEQRAALRVGAAIAPGPLESLGAHYYMGNTKIATMFASHGASGKRRWAALGDWTSWSDDCLCVCR
jgi:hypothetical protein